MAVSGLLTFTNFLLLSILALYFSNGFPNLFNPQPNQTNLVVYVHDYFTGEDASAITVGGRKGPESSVLEFGTVIVVDDPVTEGPKIESREIGRAQGMYINSQSDGKGLYMVFSLIFSGGEFGGSSLEIQGSDLFTTKEREFGVVSGTGFFRFVKGFGIMQTESMDLVNLRAVIKLNITVKHY
ncbi:dirigent protein 11-like [Cucumis melo var. makuwa]|uniref:Dirigent protein n=1 Tax=Cucumis melo var. makuwa TaxID=1194695 RepID=A0A5A7U7U2_CUCMM|nr:dirigent protein 11-like [Cucumis melo var. makuwa]TYK16226.1 dirigent protein 11-like [Cucumis melo var. makuwa]